MWELLTPREREIAEALCGGLCNKDIGKRIGIETRTVKSILNKMALRLGLNDPRYLIRIRIAVALLREREQSSIHHLPHPLCCHPDGFDYPQPSDATLRESLRPGRDS